MFWVAGHTLCTPPLEVGVLDGVTTNPSLIAKTGKTFEQVVREILKVIDGPVNLEVVGTDAETMVAEGRNLIAFGENVVVKIPMLAEGLKAVKRLTSEGIKTNVTLIFSPAQALLAAKAGASYVSPFLGRLDDIGHEGMEIVAHIREIFDNYDYETEILAASIRSTLHFVEAARLGADVATVPFKVILSLTQHPLTDKGLAKFLADWEKVKD
ncbi:fructose-6-phosphate aldolase [Nitrospinae bacterium AH_259_B05_G02_I21]|nr:fructose-6-phosphate aldolase [Nitrospinae bacterium AH_259_B05_G02_I21]